MPQQAESDIGKAVLLDSAIQQPPFPKHGEHFREEARDFKIPEATSKDGKTLEEMFRIIEELHGKRNVRDLEGGGFKPNKAQKSYENLNELNLQYGRHGPEIAPDSSPLGKPKSVMYQNEMFMKNMHDSMSDELMHKHDSMLKFDERSLLSYQMQFAIPIIPIFALLLPIRIPNYNSLMIQEKPKNLEKSYRMSVIKRKPIETMMEANDKFQHNLNQNDENIINSFIVPIKEANISNDNLAFKQNNNRQFDDNNQRKFAMHN